MGTRASASGAAALLVVGLALTACGSDTEPAVGTGTLTIEVVDITDAVGSSLRAELIGAVDYGERPPVWQLLEVPVDASPFTASQTLRDMPEGGFDLSVVAEPAADGATGQAGKGIGCEYTFSMGTGEQVTITIDGLNPFGDKGYGPCRATLDR